eukprot:366538-Chlamydomonas_euryale.AAC.7
MKFSEPGKDGAHGQLNKRTGWACPARVYMNPIHAPSRIIMDLALPQRICGPENNWPGEVAIGIVLNIWWQLEIAWERVGRAAHWAFVCALRVWHLYARGIMT